MNGRQRSVGNTVKNISLLLLAAMLAVLCAANWLSGLNIAQMPSGSLLRRAYDRFSGSAAGYELRASGVPAAEPAQLALTVDGQLYGIQYNLSEIDAGVEAMRALWAQVLSGGTPREADEAELSAALGGDVCALLRYHGAIPLSVVAGWMGGSWDSSLAVETLLYAADTQTLFIRTGGGALYAASVRAAQDAVETAQAGFRGLPCKFSGGAYAVYPETLLFDRETLSLPLLAAGAPALFDPQSGAGLETLLGAFRYTPYARTYTEQGGQSRVFVDGVSTLRVHTSGLVQFASSSADSIVRAYEDSAPDGLRVLDAQIDCARQVLDGALRAAETGTHASLYAVRQQEGGRTAIIFTQMYGGVPVLEENDFAVFVFDGEALLSATLRLQCFQPEETRRTVLPARQAAAGAAGEPCGLMTAYREAEGRYVPARFYV